MAQTVKCLPTMRETQVRFLGWEDPLEKEMATHSSTLAWKIPWTEKPGRLQSIGSRTVGHNWVTSSHFISLHFTSQKVLNSASTPFHQKRALTGQWGQDHLRGLWEVVKELEKLETMSWLQMWSWWLIGSRWQELKYLGVLDTFGWESSRIQEDK